MSASKSRKLPLLSLSEPDSYDNYETTDTGKNGLVMRLKKVTSDSSGKENKRKTVTPKHIASTGVPEKMDVDSDSDSDIDDLMLNLKKTGVRTGSLGKQNLSVQKTTPKNSPAAVKKQLFSESISSAESGRSTRATPNRQEDVDSPRSSQLSLKNTDESGRGKRARSTDSDKSDDSNQSEKRPRKRPKRESEKLDVMPKIKEEEEIVGLSEVERRAKEANDLFLRLLANDSDSSGPIKSFIKKIKSQVSEKMATQTTPVKKSRVSAPKTPVSSRSKDPKLLGTPRTPLMSERSLIVTTPKSSKPSVRLSKTPRTPLLEYPESPDSALVVTTPKVRRPSLSTPGGKTTKKKETPLKNTTLLEQPDSPDEALVTPRRVGRPSLSTPASKTAKKKETPLKKSESPDDALIAATPKARRPSLSNPSSKTAKKKETPLKKATPLKNGISTIREAPCTPVNRTRRTFGTPKTPLEEARVQLHVSSVPSCLPCREQEYQNIFNFVESKVIDGVGGCMYISGVPGTGKTATVTQVIRKLQATATDGDIPAFKYIEINGMRLSDPRQAYVQLYQQIFGKKERISSDAAYKKLDAYFNKCDEKKITTVVLVDELDLMCTRKQDVVYNLLDWPSRSRSKLVVLTIANTMDMPERKLKGRVNSRLGLTRLTFLPYTHKQLEEIIMARLQGTEAFVLDAVRLATRKVAAVSGDARRALDICRRATELPEPDEPVRITHIEKAIKEMTNSNIVRLIRCCSEVEKLFLRAVSDVCVRSGLEEVDLVQVVDHLLPMCVLEGMPAPPVPALLQCCQRLKCFRLLFTNSPSVSLMQRLTLNFTQDDLFYALKADT